MSDTKAEDLLAGQEEEVTQEEVTETPEQDIEVQDQATAEVEADQPVEEAAPPKPSFLDELGELGFENIENEQDAQARMLEAYRQTQSQLEQIQRERQQLETFAEYGRQYLDELRQQKAPPSSGLSTKDKSEPSEEQRPWWNPPAVNHQAIEKYRVQDPETREWTWKQGTPAELIANVEAYQLYREEWADRLTTNPVEALTPFREEVLKEARKIAEEIYENRDSARANETFLDQIRRENDWIFQKDPRTNQPTQALSPEGQRVMELCDELAEAGVTDPRRQWELATRMFEKQSQASETRVQSTSEQMRRSHLKKAASTPNRSGSRPSREEDDGRTRNVNHSAGQTLLDQLEQDGVGIL